MPTWFRWVKDETLQGRSTRRRSCLFVDVSSGGTFARSAKVCRVVSDVVRQLVAGKQFVFTYIALSVPFDVNRSCRGSTESLGSRAAGQDQTFAQRSGGEHRARFR